MIVPPFGRILAASAIFLGLSSQPFAAGLASTGKDIALKWCASCHVVTEGQESASADVPAFASIAERYGEEIGALEAFLADPHPVMPDMSLTRQEIRDLLAYIDSLD